MHTYAPYSLSDLQHAQASVDTFGLSQPEHACAGDPDTDLLAILSLCLDILGVGASAGAVLVILIPISLAAVILAVGGADVAIARQVGLIVGDLLALPLAQVHRLCRFRCLRAQYM